MNSKKDPFQPDFNAQLARRMSTAEYELATLKEELYNTQKALNNAKIDLSEIKPSIYTNDAQKLKNKLRVAVEALEKISDRFNPDPNYFIAQIALDRLRE